MKIFKNLMVFALSISIFICIGLNAWYIYLKMYGEEKTIDQTVIVSDMTASKLDTTTGENIEENRVFAEFNIFDNAVEIKFNFFMNRNDLDILVLQKQGLLP